MDGQVTQSRAGFVWIRARYVVALHGRGDPSRQMLRRIRPRSSICVDLRGVQKLDPRSHQNDDGAGRFRFAQFDTESLTRSLCRSGKLLGPNPYPEIAKSARRDIFGKIFVHFCRDVARVEPALLEAAMSAPDDTRTADAERLSPPLPSVNPIHLICAYLARRRPRCHPRTAP